MVEEVRAEQTAVVHMEERADEQPGLHKVWSAEKRADDEPGAPSIWSVEKRADDEPGAPGIWSVEKRAPVAAKSKQLKRANYRRREQLRVPGRRSFATKVLALTNDYR